MDLRFDRYAPLGGASHRDLATGRRVHLMVWPVPDADWRNRWRRRVAGLLAGCAGLEPLVDAGESGAHAVFEVHDLHLRASLRPRLTSMPHPAIDALQWLRARDCCPGPCRLTRLLPDGRLCSDAQCGWPIETTRERAAARRQWRAWARVLHAPLIARRSEGHLRLSCGEATGEETDGWYQEWDDDSRAGLVTLPLTSAQAQRFARVTGRVVVAADLPPEALDPALLARRSFVILAGPRYARAVWATRLAEAGSYAHYAVPASTSASVVHERAHAYDALPPDSSAGGRHRAADKCGRQFLAAATAALAANRIALAIRLSSRALQRAGADGPDQGDAAALKVRALRCAGDLAHARDVAKRAAAGMRPHAPLLVEAAEAASDEGALAQAEAFARAAEMAATSEADAARARVALDRACVWRGRSAVHRLWRERAAWHVWGRSPVWPRRGGYPHAPFGRLAQWEWQCDRLERALWTGETRQARRLAAAMQRAFDGMPGLLRARTLWLVAGDPRAARRCGAVGVLETGKAGGVVEVFEHMSSLLSASQDGDDEDRATALAAICARTRRVLGARVVAVYAAAPDAGSLPVAGDGHRWRAPAPLAARAMAAVHAIGPERSAAGAQAAVPVRQGRSADGALFARWAPHASPDVARVRMLLEASALVTGPVVRSWLLTACPPAPADMPEIIGTSAAVESVRDAIRRAARVPFPVLIEGESGVGKELVARAIHRLSTRGARPFRALNCAAMAEDLVEAEMFGHAAGAFTGAGPARPGLFEDADRGTLLLDEVSELSARAQAKLLRVLQEGEVRRVGESAARRVDVRVLAAANCSLRAAVESRAFRADLLFRLDVLRVVVPPLRERLDDLPALCAHFWRECAARTGTGATLSSDAIGRLAEHAWPGNIRELQNVLAGIAVDAPKRGRIGVGKLPAHLTGDEGAPRLTLQQARTGLERDLVRAALARAGGRPSRAAAELGVSRQGLAKLMRRLGLSAA